MEYENQYMDLGWIDWDRNDSEKITDKYMNRAIRDEDDYKNCSGKEGFCQKESSGRKNDYVIAMAYVLWQRWGPLFEGCEGLDRGTIFPELYKPFRGKECKRDGKR